jgi:hypothetical protein
MRSAAPGPPVLLDVGLEGDHVHQRQVQRRADRLHRAECCAAAAPEQVAKRARVDMCAPGQLTPSPAAQYALSLDHLDVRGSARPPESALATPPVEVRRGGRCPPGRRRHDGGSGQHAIALAPISATRPASTEGSNGQAIITWTCLPPSRPMVGLMAGAHATRPVRRPAPPRSARTAR